jgi:hypothetical protein
MPTRAGVFLALCVLSIPFAACYGQTKPSQDVALRPGQTVRVWLADGQRFEGRLVAVDSSPLVLRFAGPHPVVALTAIDSLWLRRQSSGRGALIGGIVVGGVSFAGAAAFCVALGEGSGCDAWGAVALVTLGGAGVGALLGAGVGGLFPRWKRIEPQRVTISFGVGGRGLQAGARIHF